jgi:two-component system, cell cycle response regulator
MESSIVKKNMLKALQREVEQLNECCARLMGENECLKQLVYIDDLTGLFNFRFLKMRLEEELSRAKRHRRDFALIMIDIDNLKEINDNYGHQVGNQVIIELSRCLKQSLRNIDIISRFGGDEFIILLPDTSAEHARLVAQRITSNIESHTFFLTPSENQLKVSISGGIVFLADYTISGEDLIKQADQLMYLAKLQGRHCVNFVMSEEFIDKTACSKN